MSRSMNLASVFYPSKATGSDVVDAVDFSCYLNFCSRYYIDKTILHRVIKICIIAQTIPPRDINLSFLIFIIEWSDCIWKYYLLKRHTIIFTSKLLFYKFYCSVYLITFFILLYNLLQTFILSFIIIFILQFKDFESVIYS